MSNDDTEFEDLVPKHDANSAAMKLANRMVKYWLRQARSADPSKAKKGENLSKYWLKAAILISEKDHELTKELSV